MDYHRTVKISNCSVCPISSLPIRHSQNWILKKTSDPSYSAEFSLIGDSIIHSEIHGTTTLALSKEYLAMLDALVLELIPDHKHFIFIEDYHDHHGATRESRNFYTHHQKINPRIEATIFFGVSKFFAAIIRVGRVLSRVPYPVEIASDYPEAIRLAVKLQQTINSKSLIQANPLPASPLSWKLEVGTFKVIFTILPGSILLTETFGKLNTADQVATFTEKYTEILATLDHAHEGYYRLMDWSGLTHVSWTARAHYIKAFKEIQTRYPCRMAVLFGLGPFLSALLSASRHFLPIPMKATKTRQEALDLIRNHAKTHDHKLSRTRENSTLLSHSKVDAEIRRLIDIMADINWEQRGFDISPQSLEEAGPFKPLYEALFILKQDYDEINRQKSSAENKQKEIEEQLHHSEKMQTLGELAGGIAHDFNNMLGGISGFAALLQKKYGPLDPGIDRYANMILDTGKRAGALTQKLLAFSRKGRNETVTISVHELIQNIVALITHMIDKKVRVSLLLNAPDPFIMGDRSLLQNALLNLAINAADAMPNGGTLSICTSLKTLNNNAIASLLFPVPIGDYLEISVKDTGTGIPPEIRKKIFEPFFTTKNAGKGTGLGLSSVYGTLQAHNAAIGLESEPLLGTSFNLYFKTVTPLPSPETTISPKKSLTEKRHEHILLVDDEIVLRHAVQEMLLELGYQVTVCNDGQEAYELFQKTPQAFDLVLLDMIMPRMDGSECFRKLKEIRPGVRVILSTGYADHNQISALLAEGAVGYLAKPYPFDALAEILTKSLA